MTDPKKIARMISKDITVNNGFLFESVYEPVPGVKIEFNLKSEEEVGASQDFGGAASVKIYSFNADFNGNVKSGEIKVYLIDGKFDGLSKPYEVGNEEREIIFNDEEEQYFLDTLDDELEGTT